MRITDQHLAALQDEAAKAGHAPSRADENLSYEEWLEEQLVLTRARVAALDAGTDDMVDGHDEDADEKPGGKA